MEYNLDHLIYQEKWRNPVSGDQNNYSISVKKDVKFNCSECSKKTTTQKCVQCNVPYCKGCFDLVHSFGKSLQMHKTVSLGKESIQLCKSNKMCRDHTSLELDYFCADCSLAICMDCRPKHSKHTISTLILEVSLLR